MGKSQTSDHEKLSQLIKEFKTKKLPLEKAMEAFHPFINGERTRPDALHMMGIVAAEKNDFEESVQLIKEAISARPAVSFFYHNLAASYRALGEFDLARQNYERAIELEPEYAEAYFNLFDSQKFRNGHYLRSRLEEQIRNVKKFSGEDQCFLHFAAGKLYDDLGQFDKAFEQFKKGSAAKKARFNARQYFNQVDGLILSGTSAQFSRRYDERIQKFPELAKMQPVFIVSMPRAGSTLVESILSKHSKVRALGELEDIASIAGTLSRHPKIPGTYPSNLLSVSDDVLNSFAKQYLKTAGVEHPQTRIVDKMPVNHRHLGLICLLFPGAKILHCHRDPRDVCLSCFSKRFRQRHDYSYSLRGLAAFYAGYYRLMQHWHNVCPIPIHNIRYEDVIDDQESETRGILQYCELKWEAECLDFSTSKRAIRTASNWQARQGLYSSSLARWKNYARHLRPLVSELARYGVPITSSYDSGRNDDQQVQELNRLGTVAQNNKKFAKAIGLFNKAIQLDGENAISYFNRGNAQLAAGALKDAAASYRLAVQYKPDYVKALNNLAAVELASQNFRTAIGVSETALEFSPDFPAAHCNLARALAGINDYPRAIESYQRAIELDPKNIGSRLDYVSALAETGDFVEVENQCRQLLNVNKNVAKAYSWLSKVAPESISGSEKDHIANLATNKRIPAADRRVANFVLARLESRSKKFDNAFQCYKAANRLTVSRHRPKSNEQLCDDIIDLFSQGVFDRYPFKGSESRQPVFIVGMPRSGTSLTASILGAHPQISNIGECSGIRDIANANFKKGTNPLYQNVGPNLIDEVQLKVVAELYLEKIQSLAEPDSTLIVDKWPTNFFHLGLIMLMFPKAKIVHCRRDALDTCLSCYFQNFSGVAYANNLQHIGLFYQQYRRLMQHWYRLFGEQIIDFSYEEMTQNPQQQIARLLEFCGVELDDQCLNFWQRDQVVKTASVHQVRNPINSNSVGRWKNYRKHLSGLARLIGYEMGPESE